MNFSYWENKELIGDNDIVIIGSGITGLSTAIHLKRTSPSLKILILERGVLPWGASTKNAGFACFGSLGEVLDDLQNTSLDEIVRLIENRNNGLNALINLLGKEAIDFQLNGGFELFRPEQKEEYAACLDRMDDLNDALRKEFGGAVYSNEKRDFGFKGVIGIIKNQYEGQVDTGKMMKAYLDLARKEGVNIINGAEVTQYSSIQSGVELEINNGLKIKTGKLVICSNGFAKQFLNEDVEPARAQVLITKPIPNLPLKGTFHYDKGYYYFRNIHNRVLFGGGRNLDFKGENTTEMECTSQVIDTLNDILSNVVLPNTNYEVDYHWAGIMGVGDNKEPIIKEIGNNILCAVRLGGMGVALGTMVGKEAAKKLVG